MSTYYKWHNWIKNVKHQLIGSRITYCAHVGRKLLQHISCQDNDKSGQFRFSGTHQGSEYPTIYCKKEIPHARLISVLRSRYARLQNRRTISIHILMKWSWSPTTALLLQVAGRTAQKKTISWAYYRATYWMHYFFSQGYSFTFI